MHQEQNSLKNGVAWNSCFLKNAFRESSIKLNSVKGTLFVDYSQLSNNINNIIILVLWHDVKSKGKVW